ncbi:MAG: endonuclease V [Thiotrichaceae bacterium]|nr:endonuclease V [Thiotrichaceae bacterium]
MLCAIDVFYQNNPDSENDRARASAVLFNQWNDAVAEKVLTIDIEKVKPYISGKFYQRELPCILALLENLPQPSCVIVDGFVFLDQNKMGLGAYLYQALEEKIPIVGVAKNPYTNIAENCAIYRGESKKPLYITSVGMEQSEAKACVANMHGMFRFPTLLKSVDSLCRGLL